MKKLLYPWYFALAALAGAQTKISDLPALAGGDAASADVIPIVDVSAGVDGSKKITLADLFSTPVPWQGVAIAGQHGGTGVANTGKTITLGGNLTTSGANAVTLTTTGSTNVTLPTAGTLATTTEVNAKLNASAITWIDVTKAPYNAVGDGERRGDGVAVSGDNTVTSATANFPATDADSNGIPDIVGKYFRMEDVGLAGADLIGTITARNSATSIEVSVAPSSSASGKTFVWGTDNTAAGQDAIEDAYNSPVCRTVYFPPGVYLGNWRLRSQVHMLGCLRGNTLHSMPTDGQLADRQLIPTALLPAVSTLPVVYGDDAVTGGVWGACLEGFSVCGSTSKAGYGVLFGHGWGDTGFSSGNAIIRHCHVDGFDVGIGHGNAVAGEISHCWANDNNNPFEIWRHDGIIVRNCDSTTSTTTFRIGGSKNVRIESGNFNFMTTAMDITDSHVLVGTINVEDPSSAVFALRKDGDTVSLAVDFVKVLDSSTEILVRNYVPEASKNQVGVRINHSVGATYYDTVNTYVPPVLDGLNRIRRYTDATFATVVRTEKVSRALITARELEECSVASDDFFSNMSVHGTLGEFLITSDGGVSTAAQRFPLGNTGFSLFNIAAPGQNAGSTGVNYGTSNFYNAGAMRIASAGSDTDADGAGPTPGTYYISRLSYRFGNFAPMNQAYQRLEFRFALENLSSAVWRAGMWSVDDKLRPDNGLGIRVDKELGDTNVMLEIRSGGSVVATVDTGVAITALNGLRVRCIIERTSQGVSCFLFREDNGAALANEVLYATALPGWGGSHSPGVFSGANPSALASNAYSLFKVIAIQYPIDGYN